MIPHPSSVLPCLLLTQQGFPGKTEICHPLNQSSPERGKETTKAPPSGLDLGGA